MSDRALETEGCLSEGYSSNSTLPISFSYHPLSYMRALVGSKANKRGRSERAIARERSKTTTSSRPECRWRSARIGRLCCCAASIGVCMCARALLLAVYNRRVLELLASSARTRLFSPRSPLSVARILSKLTAAKRTRFFFTTVPFVSLLLCCLSFFSRFLSLRRGRVHFGVYTEIGTAALRVNFIMPDAPGYTNKYTDIERTCTD